MKQKLTQLFITRKLGIQASTAAKRRIIFNILLISAVVAALVFAQLFVVSMSKGIASKYALLGNGHLQVHTQGEVNIPAMEEILDIQHVGQTFSLIYSPAKNLMIRLKGVQQGYFNTMRLKELSLLHDDMAPDGSALPKIMLSASLATQLDVSQGDRVALMMISKGALRPQLCIVGNLYDSGYKELDEHLVFCDYTLLEKLFSDDVDTYYELLIQGDESARIKDILSQQGYVVTSWEEENQAVATNLETSRQAVFGVMLVVAILCGYFVSELSRELIEDDKASIALLKLLGGTNSFIRNVYFSTVMLVTFIAMILGSTIGIVLGMNLGGLLSLLASYSFPALSFYLLDFAVVIPWLDISRILIALVVVSAISVLFSLRRVANIPLLISTHFD